MDFKINLRYIRERNGLTQAELAEKVGVSQGAVSGYEKGSLRPTIDVCAKLAKALGVTMDELMHGERRKAE